MTSRLHYLNPFMMKSLKFTFKNGFYTKSSLIFSILVLSRTITINFPVYLTFIPQKSITDVKFKRKKITNWLPNSISYVVLYVYLYFWHFFSLKFITESICYFFLPLKKCGKCLHFLMWQMYENPWIRFKNRQRHALFPHQLFILLIFSVMVAI